MRRLSTLVAILGLACPTWADGLPEACKGPDILRVWEWTGDPLTFPEQTDPELAVREVLERAEESFAIAFSGGGTRSSSATLGQLRALDSLGWIERAQYISAVSGGSWAAIPFTFLPPDLDEKKFLGPLVEPDQISRAALEHEPELSFARASSSTRIPALYLSRVLWRKDETYSRALGKKILRDFDLYEGERRGRCEGPARLAAHERQRSRLQQGAAVRRPRGRHPWQCLCPDGSDGKTLCDDEFLVSRPGRPFLIVGATVLEKKRGKSKAHLVELTPLYSGSRERFKVRFRGRHVALGGSYIETAAYDSVLKFAPGEPSQGRREFSACFKKALSKYRYRMTLSDMMGASGAAPVALLRGIGFRTLGFPEFYLRSPGDSSEEAPEVAHGDGGHVDNLGLSALLARGVENILAFANSQSPFCLADDAKCIKKNKGLRMASDIQCYFEQTPETDPKGRCQKKRKKKNAAVPTLFAGAGLQPILDRFEELKRDKKPLIFCGEFELAATLPKEAGPLPDYRPRICFVQLDRNQAWLDAVAASPGGSDKLVYKLANTRGRTFRNFPHFKTLGERFWKFRIIDMSEAQVNALAHLTTWTTMQGSATIESCLLSKSPKCDYRAGDA